MRRLRVPALIVLIIILATCSAPREAGTPTKTATPTDALIQLEVLPTTTPAPTSTRAVTKTPRPWQTMTIAPTATAMPSLTPLPTINTTLVPTGIKITKQKDNTILVIDYDDKFQFVAPTGWNIAPLQGKAPIDRLLTLGKTIPNINRTSLFLNVLSPNIAVIGLNTSVTVAGMGYPVVLRMGTLSDPSKSQMQLDIAAKSIRSGLEKAGYKVIQSNAKTYANSVKAIVLDVTEEFQVRQNEQFVTLTVSSRVVIFKASGKLVILSAAAPKQFAESATSAVDKIMASLTFLK